VDAKRAPGVVEPGGEEPGPGREVQPGARAEYDRGGGEQEKGRSDRERGAPQPGRADGDQDHPALAEPVDEHAPGKLEQRVGGPHPRERDPDRTLRDRERVDDLGDERTRRQSGGHRHEKGRRRETE